MRQRKYNYPIGARKVLVQLLATSGSARPIIFGMAIRSLWLFLLAAEQLIIIYPRVRSESAPNETTQRGERRFGNHRTGYGSVARTSSRLRLALTPQMSAHSSIGFPSWHHFRAMTETQWKNVQRVHLGVSEKHNLLDVRVPSIAGAMVSKTPFAS